MLKKIVTSAAILFSCMTLQAEATHVTIELKNGDKIDFRLSEKPIITFLDGDLVVNGNESTSYAISNVKRYVFTEKDLSSSPLSTTGDLHIEVIDNAGLQVLNAPASATITLMSANGMLISSKNANKSGECFIETPSQKGVYILSVGSKSFKLIRK